MKFNNNKKFKKHKCHNGTLWLAGWCDHPIGKLNYLFSDHKIPVIRGQFGLVWQGNDGWWLAMCDHVCSFPLWYRENTNEVFSTYTDIDSKDIDPVFFAQRDILNGQMTVGPRTGWNDVIRIQPDHCIDFGTQKRYRNSIDVSSNGPHIDDWHDILNSAIRRNIKDGMCLMLSGGRDSTTIANYAVRNNIDLEYCHITRNTNYADTQCVLQFASEIGINVKLYNPFDNMDIYDEGDYWHDSSYNPKRHILKNLQNNVGGVTGEFGASESGSKKINTILQRPDITIEQLTNIWITTLEARDESVASYRIHDDYIEFNDTPWLYKEAYDEIIKYFEDLYVLSKSKTDDTNQLMKLVTMLHQQDHEVYRLHNYSQDTFTWVHPFTDPYWCDIIFNCDIDTKKLNHHQREVYRLASGDWFVDTAWNYGGPRGLTQI